MRLLRLETESDSLLLCRLVGRAVPDPNLRGWAHVEEEPADDFVTHIVRGALARTRVLLLTGAKGLALCGDLFSLHLAGRELAVLERTHAAALGRRLQDETQALEQGPAPLAIGRRTFDWKRPVVMGVLNVTPDSFSDGGNFSDPEAALAHGLRLLEAGADVLDIGGESTRPRGRAYGEGAQTVPVQEEIDRVVPVVRALRARTDAPLSIDTRKASVARAALEAGANLVNDVTGLLHDPALGLEAARAGVPLCLMHVPADIEALSHEQPSDDVVRDVVSGLRAAVERALAAGVPRERLLLDPGLGFGKTPAGNFTLIRHLEAIAALGLPVVVGASRKASFAKVSAPEQTAPLPVSERLPASLAAAVTAYLRGAHVLRVHDVLETARALRTAAAVRSAEG